jgi:molybdenum cofactor synthesis domain-containing protein
MLSCAVISIGSELLSGQIINRNAPWISSQLFDLGVDTVFQMTVDDKIQDIVDALELAAKKSSLIFCTGGLGPTSDDLTRLAVSQWLQDPLVYHPESWDHITQIFEAYQLTPPEANKQQCFFPSKAQVLFNRAGTANAFVSASTKRTIVVLPGPPKEIDAIWQDHLKTMFTQSLDPSHKKSFYSWRTIGKGESHIAEIVENILKPLVETRSIDLAYRAHAPFIETKLRFDPSLDSVIQPYVAKLSAALSPWLYESGDANWCRDFAQFLQTKSQVCFYDFATSGQIQALLVPWIEKIHKESPEKVILPELLFFNSFYLKSKTALPKLATDVPSSVHFQVGINEGDAHWEIRSWDGLHSYQKSYPLPYKIATRSVGLNGQAPRSDRNGLAIASLAIKAWYLDWTQQGDDFLAGSRVEA